jgi:2,3-bisphosphoglycerate-independent phosphoglycerate mutase
MGRMSSETKYVIIVGDGMADYPMVSLQGKTPLMAAKTAHMDWMARQGEIGLARTIPEGFNPGSEIANLSIFGYDPARYYTGRGPLEAASLGISLQPGDIAFRCNLVTLQGDGSRRIMEDFSAGHITDEEAKEIIFDLNKKMGNEEIQFYPGVSYRHVMVLKNGAAKFSNLEKLELTPPHDIIGKEISSFLPEIHAASQAQNISNNGAKDILNLMEESQGFLKSHPVNTLRMAKGFQPANSIWLWGQGRSPQMITLKERFGIEGYIISAVHLLKGIGILAGLDVLNVPGATGYFDTNYDGKAQYALRGLRERDFVYVHVEAPDEASHMGDLSLKIETIEVFDEKIVGAILKGIKDFERYKVMVLPDHPTPLSIRTHAADPIPYVIYSNMEGKDDLHGEGFDEVSARKSGILIEKGFKLIERFLTPHTSS